MQDLRWYERNQEEAYNAVMNEWGDYYQEYSDILELGNDQGLSLMMDVIKYEDVDLEDTIYFGESCEVLDQVAYEATLMQMMDEWIKENKNIYKDEILKTMRYEIDRDIEGLPSWEYEALERALDEIKAKVKEMLEFEELDKMKFGQRDRDIRTKFEDEADSWDWYYKEFGGA